MCVWAGLWRTAGLLVKVDGVQVDKSADFPALSWKEVTQGMEDAAMFAHLVVWGEWKGELLCSPRHEVLP